jgi:hypothetical protein
MISEDQNTCVAVVHPQVLPFLSDLIASLSNQSFKTFKLLLFSDAVLEEAIRAKLIDLTFDIEIVQLPKISISNNRLWLLNYLKDHAIGYIHFIDGDDTIETDYLKITVQHLEKHKLVCHDLNIVNANLQLIESSYWSARLINGFVFDYHFIMSKNIVGLGNTSIHSELLGYVNFDKEIDCMIPDWLLFYEILYRSKAKASFISETKVNYRQHNNIAQINILTKESILSKLKATINHFEAIKAFKLPIDNGYDTKINMLGNSLPEKLLTDFIKESTQIHYFWWEEIPELLKYYEDYIRK